MTNQQSEKALGPGDVIRWQCPTFPENAHEWLVRGVHLGGPTTESVVEIENISHKPAWTGEWESHPVMFVPECLLRRLPIVGQRKPDMGAALRRSATLVHKARKDTP